MAIPPGEYLSQRAAEAKPDALRLLRLTAFATTAVFLNGSAENEARARELGTNEFMVNPIDAATLFGMPAGMLCHDLEVGTAEFPTRKR